MQQFIIGPRFNGPPTSGHGGYAAGSLASFIGPSAEITLRKPPPLDEPMTIVRTGDVVAAMHGETLIMEGREAVPTGDVPTPPTLEEARAAVPSPMIMDEHAFPTCFACGPARTDGLRIFVGPVRDNLLAAPWSPDLSLDAGDGIVDPRFVWAALDCPGAWAPMNATGRAAPLLLGRIVAMVEREVKIGEALIVTAWFRAQEGRKHFTGTALHDEGGHLVARAEHVWIELKS
jgi:hypothetical protein